MIFSQAIQKNYFNFFILFYLITSIILSVDVGISHDEHHHLSVWQINKKIYSNFFLGTNYEILFNDLGMQFYGIGFHIFSAPIEFFLKFIKFDLLFSNELNDLTIKHPSIVIFFLISGIYFKKILNLIIENKNYSQVCSILFLLYPYLLGHSFFNTLDIPFMSVWICSTYYVMKIFKIFLKTKNISYRYIIYLALLSAFLLSIRISGLLIFIQYLIFLIFSINILNINFFNFLKILYKQIILFTLLFVFTFYFFHPNYWLDPFKAYQSILYMSNHIQTVCTITLGECMKAQNLPSSYIPIWLFFKLPILILFGLTVFPFVEKKIFKNSLHTLFLGSLLTTIISIILTLIIFNVNLYNEIRQIMFLVTLIFLVSLSFLYFFSKKISYSLIFLYLIFFTAQNIKIYPYNYLWLNNFSNITKINNVFELDYWGLSTRNISNFFNQNSINGCIISNRNETLKLLINKKDNCFINFRELHKKNERPFYVVLMERNLKKGIPINCFKLYTEKIFINFTTESLDLAKIYKCS